MTVKYFCSRCGYSTNYRGTFLRHLNRKNICPAHISDMKIAVHHRRSIIYKNFIKKNEKTNNYKKTRKNDKKGQKYG